MSSSAAKIPLAPQWKYTYNNKPFHELQRNCLLGMADDMSVESVEDVTISYTCELCYMPLYDPKYATMDPAFCDECVDIIRDIDEEYERRAMVSELPRPPVVEDTPVEDESPAEE